MGRGSGGGGRGGGGGMSAEEKKSAKQGDWGMPAISATPAYKRAAAAAAAAAKGPGGMMSPEYKAAYKKQQGLGEIARVANSQASSTRQAHNTIKRYEGRTGGLAARRISSAKQTLSRIQQSVGAKSTGESTLMQAIRSKFTKETR